jgi:hypothetical protein
MWSYLFNMVVYTIDHIHNPIKRLIISRVLLRNLQKKHHRLSVKHEDHPRTYRHHCLTCDSNRYSFAHMIPCFNISSSNIITMHGLIFLWCYFVSAEGACFGRTTFPTPPCETTSCHSTCETFFNGTQCSGCTWSSKCVEDGGCQCTICPPSQQSKERNTN